MTTLFFDDFLNLNSWSTSVLIIVSDPKGKFNNVVTFSGASALPSAFSKAIYNSYKSYTLTFDYLGLPLNIDKAVNLGGLIGISDGASMVDLSISYAGAIKNTDPPISLCKGVITTWSYYGSNCGGGYCSINCETYYSYKSNNLLFLTDNKEWGHYSISFSANSYNIRLSLGDYLWANYPESGIPGDSYFANILVTDSYGPSEFIATAAIESFRAISVDVLDKIAETVSYVNSNAAIRVNLETLISTGGYANGDKFYEIRCIIGSKYSDQFIGDSANNIFEGGEGDDTFTTSKGYDIFIGGLGRDKFIITENIDSTEISDFDLNNDSIDLTSFNKFYSLGSVLAVSSNIGSSTLITIESEKYLTLKGINFQNLKAENFLISTHSPSSTPSLSPTLNPTEYPTISFNPTCTPTHDPTVSPTPSPTPKYIDIYIKSGGVYYGSEVQENFLINATRNTEIYGMGGIDKFTIFSHEYTTIKLMDFNAADETVDLHEFQNLRKFSDLGLSEDPLTISLLNGQKVIFPNLDIEELSAGNFIFTDSIPPIYPQQDSSNNGEIILGLSIGVGLLGITLIGIGCCYCCSMNK